ALLTAAGRAVGGALPARAAALAEEVLRTMFLIKLKTVALVLALLGVFGGGAGLLALPAGADRPGPRGAKAAGPAPAAGKAKPPSDLDLLQGPWRGVTLEYEGKDVTEAALVGATTWVVVGDEITVRIRGEDRGRWRLRLDPTAQPKAIDL